MQTHPVLATILLMTITAVAVAPVEAQRAGDLFGGDLPQEYTNGINNKFERMGLDQMLDDPEVLEPFYSTERLESESSRRSGPSTARTLAHDRQTGNHPCADSSIPSTAASHPFSAQPC